MSELVDIIDAGNNVVGTKERAGVLSTNMLRYVQVYLFNSNGLMYVQQRAEGRVRAGQLDPSAAGHVQSGESFENAAARELKEELGVEVDLEYVCEISGDYGCAKVYKGTYDGDVTPDAKEVQVLDKISFFELKEIYRRYPYIMSFGFVDSFKAYLQTIYPLMDYVDDGDNVLGQCEYADIKAKGRRIRTAHVMIYNKKGEFLLQQKSKNVGVYPLCLDNSSAGHVDTGETYKQAAIRETKEELGVDIDLTNVEPVFYGNTKDSNAFRQYFVVEHEGPFEMDIDEVAHVLWLKPEEIDLMIKKTPFLFAETFVNFYQENKVVLLEKVVS